MSRARQSVPSTHAKRIEILFQPDAVDGIVAMCIEMSGSPKFEYHPSGSVVRFTPAEFRLYMENLRAAMRDRDLDQQDKIEAREAYSSAMEQYYRQEQAGGISIGARNPLSDLSTAQTVGVVAAGAAALGVVGYFIWKSQQPAPGVALWNAFNSPGTVPPGVLTEPTLPAGYQPPPGLPALPAGYNWWNQGNMKVPNVGDSVDVVVQGGSFGTSASHPGMPGPDGQGVTGTVVSLGTVGPTTAIGTVTIRVTPYAGMPLFPTPQLLTFPLGYVTDTSGNFATPGG